MKTWSSNKVLMAMLAVLGLSMATVGFADSTPVAGATNAAPTGIIAPSQVSLPPVPAKVLQMSEAGVSDNLITAYIQKSAYAYTLDSDQIIYLHDLGVSSAVLEALVQHEGTAGNEPSAEASSGAPNQQATSPTTGTGESTPPVTGAAANFYDALAPYGTWVDVPAYGWCWQPTVVVVDSAWQPYCNNGSWLWTDQGWYWNSYYSWGWAPFHYGRWCQYPGYGWLWCPDNIWGPAWVCWRDYPGYCGWAPLPPGACFTAGLGWTFNGVAVGFNYGFGLGAGCFTFCDYDDFCGRHPFDHFRHGRDADRFFEHSRVDNDWTLDAHHRFFDHGIDPSRIEAATHTRIGQVAVREFQHGAEHSGNFTMPDRLARNGNTSVIYRPGRDLSVMRNHFQHGASPVYHWGGEHAVQGYADGRTASQPPRFQTGRQNNWQPSTPGSAWNHPGLTTFNQNQHATVIRNSSANHFPLAQSYARDFRGPDHFTPTWQSAPSSRPAPVWHPTQTAHAAPAWHPSVPAWHSTTPAFHPAPAFRPAPTFSRPAQTFGGAHFGGGSARFGGGRHR